MPQRSMTASLGAHEKHGIQAKIGGRIQTVAGVMEFADCINGSDEIIRMATNSF